MLSDYHFAQGSLVSILSILRISILRGLALSCDIGDRMRCKTPQTCEMPVLEVDGVTCTRWWSAGTHLSCTSDCGRLPRLLAESRDLEEGLTSVLGPRRDVFCTRHRLPILFPTYTRNMKNEVPTNHTIMMGFRSLSFEISLVFDVSAAAFSDEIPGKSHYYVSTKYGTMSAQSINISGSIPRLQKKTWRLWLQTN